MQQKSPLSQRRLDWIQALRGVAALSVVLTHTRRIFLDTPMWDQADKIFFPFATGVDLFFVISGFIMVYTTFGQRGPKASMAFAKRRFLRIWPAYFVVSALALPLLYGIGAWSDPASLRRFLLSVSFMPTEYGDIFGHQVLPQGWTLNFEAYFYVVFGLALFAGRFRWFAMAAWFLLSLVALPIAFSAPSLWNPLANYDKALVYPIGYMKVITSPIIWEFIGGMAAGLLYFSPLRVKGKRLAAAFAIGLALLALANTWYAYHYISLNVGWAFVALVAGWAICNKTVAIRVPSWLRRLGGISYTLYIEHLVIIEVVRRYVPAPDTMGSGIIQFTLLASSCVLIAWLTAPFLERRLPAVLSGSIGALYPLSLRSAATSARVSLRAAQSIATSWSGRIH